MIMLIKVMKNYYADGHSDDGDENAYAHDGADDDVYVPMVLIYYNDYDEKYKHAASNEYANMLLTMVMTMMNSRSLTHCTQKHMVHSIMHTDTEKRHSRAGP